MDRKQKADERYRQMFYELGLDEGWIFLGFEKKDRLWFKCKKCGAEAPKGNDIFKGRQSKLLCRTCGNGWKLYAQSVDDILAYYQDGHTVTETCEKFHVERWKLNDWVKRRHVSNGRIFTQCANEDRMKRHEPKFLEMVERKGLRLLEPYKGTNKSYLAVDLKTGAPRIIRGTESRKGDWQARRAKLLKVCDDPDIEITKLIKRDGPLCYICGKETDFNDLRWRSWGPDYPSIDHVIPLCKGGRHSWGNVRVCCGLCNVKKGGRSHEDNN